MEFTAKIKVCPSDDLDQPEAEFHLIPSPVNSADPLSSPLLICEDMKAQWVVHRIGLSKLLISMSSMKIYKCSCRRSKSEGVKN